MGPKPASLLLCEPRALSKLSERGERLYRCPLWRVQGGGTANLWRGLLRILKERPSSAGPKLDSRAATASAQ